MKRVQKQSAEITGITEEIIQRTVFTLVMSFMYTLDFAVPCSNLSGFGKEIFCVLGYARYYIFFYVQIQADRHRVSSRCLFTS